MNLNNFLSNRFFTWILNRMEADADPVSGYALQRSIQFHFIAAISICSDILFRKEKEKAVLLLPRNDKVWRGCTIRLNPTVSPELYGDTRHLLDCQASLMVLEDCVEESGGEGGELPLLQLPSTAEEAVNSGWATRLIHVNKEDGMSKEATSHGGAEKKRSKYFCSLCCRNFASNESMLVHVREKHPPKRRDGEEAELRQLYTCCVCGQEFASQETKFCHVKGRHFGEKPATAGSNPLKRSWTLAQAGCDEGGGGGPCSSCGKEYSGPLWAHESLDCWKTLYYCTSCPIVTLYT